MVVDAEVPRNRADTVAAVAHRRSPGRNRLVDGDLDGLGEFSLDLNLSDGAKPLRPRPQPLGGLGESQNSHRKNSESR